MKKQLVWIILVLAIVLLVGIVSAFAEEEVPFLTRTYPQYDVKLKLLQDQDSRVYAYAGPANSYVTGWGYKPYKQRKITAYFIENDWVFVDFDYQTVEERFVYIKKNRFESLPDGLPSISNLPSYTGKVIEDTMPAWGPSSDFNWIDDFIAKAGVRIEVFFQENGYVYAEYPCNKGTVRMWLPADKVTMDYATVSVTDETSKYHNISTFGKYPSNGFDGSYLPEFDESDNPEGNGYCTDHPNARINYKEIVVGYLDQGSEHRKESSHLLFCSVCNKQIFDYRDTAAYDFEEHTFNQYGVCIYCGHLNYLD